MQAICDAGVESWGKRRRRRAVNETDEAATSEDDMSISQEILVLDFGDEKNKDFLRSPVEPGRTPSADFDGKIMDIIGGKTLKKKNNNNSALHS